MKTSLHSRLGGLLAASATLFVSPFSVSAQEGVITVEKLPKTTEEFVALRDQLAKTPEGGAVIFVLAMQAFTEDENRGTEYLTLALDRSKLEPSSRGYKGFKPDRGMNYFFPKLADNPHWPSSYI